MNMGWGITYERFFSLMNVFIRNNIIADYHMTSAEIITLLRTSSVLPLLS